MAEDGSMTSGQHKLIKDLISEVKIDGNSFADKFISEQLFNNKWESLTKLEARMFIDFLKDRKAIEDTGKAHSERVYKAQYKMKEAVKLFNDGFNIERSENFIVFSHIALTRIIVQILINDGEDVTNSKNKTKDFSVLLNDLSRVEPEFGKENKKLLEKLNDMRNSIEHEQLSDNDIKEPMLFGNQIIECFNLLVSIGDFSEAYKVNWNTLGFKQAYSVDELISNTGDEVEVKIDEKASVDAMLIQANSSKEQIDNFRKNWKTPSEIVSLVNQNLEETKIQRKFNMNDFTIYRKSFKLVKLKNNDSYFDSLGNVKQHPDQVDIRDNTLCYSNQNLDNGSIFYSVKNVRVLTKLIKEQMENDMSKFRLLRDTYYDEVIFW